MTHPVSATLDPVEYCFERGWTDGLPVVPCSGAYLEEFLARTDREADEVVLAMPQLNRSITVRLAAINAAMAGCRPDYFPVVLAAWDSLRQEGYARKGIWQSTTGTAALLVVNGPVRDRIGLNSRGNVFGPGFRANATIGRAVRLTALNALGLRPGELDQATQGTPAKYTCCIAENQEASPWQALHAELGCSAADSAVTAMTVRSVLHIEGRHTSVAEQLLRDIVDTVSRTGALLHETISSCVVLSPEHAHLLAASGWDKRDIREFVFEESVRSRASLDRVGKGAVSRKTRWRVPIDHPDAVIDEGVDGDRDALRVLTSPDAVVVLVAGAPNAGVSSVVETFGPRGSRPPIARVEEDRR
ncbi:MAG: hypothetical protein GEV09_14780 [Pseudonocardiaceae bacterium]|nr:hypothetical protein [Pseudonocardiaceae bacterium]